MFPSEYHFVKILQAEELSKTRESLIEAETSRKHLDEKVQDLTRQMHGNQEKLAVYERRPTSANGAGHRSVDESLSREQQLESEVAELRYALWKLGMYSSLICCCTEEH